MNKSIHLISNANSDVFDNTLSHFSNRPAHPIICKQDENWEVAIEKIVFPLSFQSVYLPRDARFPTFLFYMRGPPPTLLQECVRGKYVHPIYLSRYRKYSSYEDLDQELSRFQPTFLKYEISEHHLKIDSKKRLARLLVHHSFLNSFNVDKTLYRRHSIGKEKYCMLYLKSHILTSDYDEEHLLIKFDRNSFLPKIPSYIRVCTSIISRHISSDGFDNTLAIVAKNFTGAQAFYHEFQERDFFPLAFQDIRKIDISIFDENRNRLCLAPGPPTIVKLVFRSKMGVTDFNVRISSKTTRVHTENNAAQFTINLPQTLQLLGRWYAAVTSITFPTEFTSLPYGSRKIIILAGRYKRVIRLHSEDSVITGEQIVLLLQEEAEHEIEVTADNIVRIKARKDIKLLLPMDVARILGYNKATVRETLSIKLEKDEVYDFSLGINNEVLIPLYIFLYVNIIKPVLAGSSYTKLLKVIPLRKYSSGYATEEFRNLEFCELANSEISEISFEMRTHTGGFIPFYNMEHKVLLNILFSQNEITV